MVVGHQTAPSLGWASVPLSLSWDLGVGAGEMGVSPKKIFRGVG